MASFAAAYGLRIRAPGTRIPWPEFQDLLAGLPGSTPLIQLAGLRTMTDKEAEHLPESAREARNDWLLWLSEQENAAGRHGAASLEQFFRDFCA